MLLWKETKAALRHNLSNLDWYISGYGPEITLQPCSDYVQEIYTELVWKSVVHTTTVYMYKE